MKLDLFGNRHTRLDRQRFTWRDLVQKPCSKLDDDAFTRMSVILMKGIESDSVRFQHIAQRFSQVLRLPLANMRRVEHHQRTLISWLNPSGWLYPSDQTAREVLGEAT